ncbi:MAG: hypothetical protein M1828_000690 [Chrysothrix sp. TS-e1954]|nr:MAG: hypothetical protein M1828_000690 [Chrysothrix sp. TS-e1954]
MASSDRPRNENQISALPGVKTFLTGHNADGKAIVQESRNAVWTAFGEDMAFNALYTTNFPADLNGDKDIKAHDELIKDGKLGLVKPGGVVCRQVDLAPGNKAIMHQTSSIDFGIVLEGTVEMLLDDGSCTVMKRGDVAVQRATMHAWKNPSETEWVRIQFILQDIQQLSVGGKQVKENLDEAGGTIPSSGND